MNNSINKISHNRIISFDILRIIACFSVVMLHSAAQFWYTLPVTSTDWKIANSYDAITRFGVPIFVMISGALFLNTDRELDIKKIYKNNILRLFIVYIVWSAIYGLLDCRLFDFSAIGWKDIVKEIISGRYHLWYLPMIIGIYMLLPILKLWVQNASKQNLQYFLGLFVVFQIFTETIKAWRHSPFIENVMNAFTVELACSYVGYFILGYYLYQYEIKRSTEIFIYAGGIIGIFTNIFSSMKFSISTGYAIGNTYDSYTLSTFFVVLSIYLLCTKHIPTHKFHSKTNCLITELSSSTLGIYVMHLVFIEQLEPYGIHSMMLPNIIGIPVFSIIIFLLCYLSSALLRRIPFIGKYIC